MAMVKLDPTISNINGKIGNDVWRYDQCGQHVQSLLFHGKLPTQKQYLVRRAYQHCCEAWSQGIWTLQQRASWSAWALIHRTINKKGEIKILTAFSAFLKYNIARVLAGLPIVFMAPTT